MDRTSQIRKLGDKSADRTDGTGQLGMTVETGQRWQDCHGWKDTTRRLEKTGQDCWNRSTKTGQLWQDSQERIAMTGQGQLGQDDQHRTKAEGQP